MKDIKSIVRISSNETIGCKHCPKTINGIDNFEESVNHYIVEHDYRIIHVGTETVIYPADGSLFHTTVAVLGL
ncbi:MAG: hypothetical protein GXO75_19615 [Calditrichaeota bacterium]|nr:hypothetical protein [Calditrichota bacterium]